MGLGSGCPLLARKLIPRNIDTAIVPMMARVVAAFRAWGRRKAGTPLEMASTPVSAVDPEEKAWSTTNNPTVLAVPMGKSSLGAMARGHAEVAHLINPVATMMKIDRMNP